MGPPRKMVDFWNPVHMPGAIEYAISRIFHHRGKSQVTFPSHTKCSRHRNILVSITFRKISCSECDFGQEMKGCEKNLEVYFGAKNEEMFIFTLIQGQNHEN